MALDFRQGVVVRESNRPLERALKTWTDLVDDDWGTPDDPDAGWWYNERASLSLFAGAVWKQCKDDGFCFEEYRAPKEAHGGGSHIKGRVDLWFSLFCILRKSATAAQVLPELRCRAHDGHGESLYASCRLHIPGHRAQVVG